MKPTVPLPAMARASFSSAMTPASAGEEHDVPDTCAESWESERQALSWLSRHQLNVYCARTCRRGNCIGYDLECINPLLQLTPSVRPPTTIW